MKEQNRFRIERMAARYASRQKEKSEADGARFLREFEEARERVIRPAMLEVQRELERAGHSPWIAVDEAAEKPSIELCLGLSGVPKTRGTNLVGFCVIHWRDFPEVLAYLVVSPPPMDLLRFAVPAEITQEYVEQMLVDAVEHIFACRSI
ncbi:MAG TPA: hypothetical protein VM694_30785 [Polyangium sp.]|nr:hypothetical protein [Polyangium sp.]